jgi:release factor glutamine methyltransferase
MRMAVEPDEAGLRALVGRLRAAGCVFAEDEAELLCAGAADARELEVMTARRIVGEPLELVLGWAGFRGLRIAVEPGVFVPRRRTEFLAEQAAELLTSGEAVVVDLCCGAGAVGAALLDRCGGPGGATIELHAADIEPAAVRCARRNLAASITQGTAYVYEGDLDAPLPARLHGRVAVLTANVPYVPSGEVPLLPSEAREYEPLTALDGGADGLDVLRRVAAAAPRWLRPGGSVLIEISERQQEAAEAAFHAAGLTARLVISDVYDTGVLIGRRDGSGPAR